MRSLSERVQDLDPRLTRWRLTLLALASLLAPSVMMIQHLRHLSRDLPVLIGASAALFLLVVMRIAGLVRKQEQSAVRERALRGAGTALVTATNRDGIYAAALQAAGSIAGEGSTIRVLVGRRRAEDFTVVAAKGGDEGVDRRHGLAVDPPPVEARPVEHPSFRTRSRRTNRSSPSRSGFPVDCTILLSEPLFMKDELQGLLLVGSALLSRAPTATRWRH